MIIRKYLYPLLLILLYFVFSLLRINGSSIGMWNKYFYGNDYIDNNLIFGKPRAIKSDEWLVKTPWIVSALKQNLPETNKLIGITGQKLGFVAGIPERSYLTFFKPQNIAFLFFEDEIAFSFRWWFGPFLFVSSIYFLSIFFTNNILFSILISISSFFSPYLLWWTSWDGFLLIAYGIFLFLMIIKIFNTKFSLKSILISILTIYLSTCFILEIYPPAQISIFLFIIFTLIGYLLTNSIFVRKDLIKSVLMLFFIFLFTCLNIFCVVKDNIEEIKLTVNTVYPGNRISNGGGMSPVLLFSGFFNIQLLDENKIVPDILNSNQCEASSFFLISILVLPIFVIDFLFKIQRKVKINFFFLSMVLYQIFLLIWCFIGYPKFISYITLLNRVPPNRAIIGLGLSNFFILIYFLSGSFKLEDIYFKKIYFLLYSFLIFLFYIYLGFVLKNQYPLFISNNIKIIGISFIVFALTFLFLMRRKFFFILIFLIFSCLSTYSINPLYIGFGSLSDGFFSMTIDDINDVSKNYRWVAYGDNVLNQVLLAQGVNTIGGYFYYPQFDMYKILDPKNKYKNIWNRYSNISYQLPENTGEIKFELVNLDAFIIKIDPCSKSFNDLNVKYFVFMNEIDFKKNKCLIEDARVLTSVRNFYIYKVKDNYLFE